MSEGKTSRYLKYAIGEILLVVIGILIALQINNWNENRKRLKQERVLLTQIKEEMLSQYGDISPDLEYLKFARRAHYKIIDYMKDDLPYRDSLCFYFDMLKVDEYIYPNEAVYTKLKDEGLDIIRNDSIRTGIQLLYETDFPRISREKSFHPDISEFLNPYYIENFQPNTDYNLKFSFKLQSDSIAGEVYEEINVSFPGEFEMNGEKRFYTIGFVPLDYESLKNDSKYRMLLDQVNTFRNYKIYRYERTKRLIKELVRAIDSDLDE